MAWPSKPRHAPEPERVDRRNGLRAWVNQDRHGKHGHAVELGAHAAERREDAQRP